MTLAGLLEALLKSEGEAGGVSDLFPKPDAQSLSQSGSLSVGPRA